MARRIHQHFVDVQQQIADDPYALSEDAVGFMTSGSSFFGFLASSPTRHSSMCSDGYGLSICEICLTSTRSGSSHASSTSFSKMTGILSWYCPTISFGTVVRMV